MGSPGPPVLDGETELSVGEITKLESTTMAVDEGIYVVDMRGLVDDETADSAGES